MDFIKCSKCGVESAASRGKCQACGYPFNRLLQEHYEQLDKEAFDRLIELSRACEAVNKIDIDQKKPTRATELNRFVHITNIDKFLIYWTVFALILLAISIFVGIAGNRFDYDDVEYGFYIFLRIVVFSTFIMQVGLSKSPLGWLLLGIGAILFNPFIRISMSQELWIIFDVVAMGVILFSFGNYIYKKYGLS